MVHGWGYDPTPRIGRWESGEIFSMSSSSFRLQRGAKHQMNLEASPSESYEKGREILEGLEAAAMKPQEAETAQVTTLGIVNPTCQN